jgi:malate dehydrogenase
MNNAPDIPQDRWFAMTRLDENRAAAQLAAKAGVQVSEVSNVTIWGNHSATQYPDYYNAKISGKSAPEVISDDTWAHVDFIPTVQQRGAAIIKARGASSAASAANAAIDTVRSLTNPTPEGDWNSVCVASDGSYDTKEGLLTSFPVRSDGEKWEIVQGVPINDFAREKIDVSVSELAEERELVRELLPS